MKSAHQTSIFISYSHRGNGLAWKERLFAALAVFEKQHLLAPWHDDQTKLGEDWHASINAAMKDARLAILLLTDEFLKSPFVLRHELPELRRRQKEEGLVIAPILCERCDWLQNEWLASLQIKPRVLTNPTPLSTLPEQESVCTLRQLAVDIAEGLGQAALAELPKPDQPPSPDHIYLDKLPLTPSTGLREEKLIGREQELALLDLAFAQPHTAIVSLVAWGGVGKTMLVQHWLQRLQREGWYGARRVYAWSFYSQGTKEDRQASEDTFLAHALAWFGIQCEPTLSPWDKGRLLADAVARERTLLILDGIEPLQYPPGPMGGQLRAPGVQSLLKQFARKAQKFSPSPASAGEGQTEGDAGCLCLVTTREPLTDLAGFQRREGSPWGSVLRVDLGNLADEAGAALLHHAGANRAGAAEIKTNDKELLAASREVDGHALTLNLLGRFLARAHGGDIRRRDLVKFEEADRKEQGGTTFKILAAFENWLARSGEFGARQLAILRMLGLFNRPADAGCIGALRKPPVIPGLTDSIFTTRIDASTSQATVQPLIEEDWNTATSFLADFGLVKMTAIVVEQVKGFSEAKAQTLMPLAASGFNPRFGDPDVLPLPSNSESSSLAIDAHPLIREYFAQCLIQTNPTSWRNGHRRLFEHIPETVPFWPEGLAGIAPLHQSVGHGCSAGLYQEALVLFYMRILRLNAYYSTDVLGAYGADLAAVSCFFEQPWSRLAAGLPAAARARLPNQAASFLNALGRPADALEPMHLGLKSDVERNDWGNAATAASNLSEMDLLLGDMSHALEHAQDSIRFADRTEDSFTRMSSRAAYADALHAAGRRDEAEELFKDMERRQKVEVALKYEVLFSLRGYSYCEFLLDAAQRAAWAITTGVHRELGPTERASCAQVESRASQMLTIAQENEWLTDIGLANLMDGICKLCAGILDGPTSPSGRASLQRARHWLNTGLNGLRNDGEARYVALAVLPNAWLRFLEGDSSGARADLDEAWDIAERGPMRLRMADIHLYRARLFFRKKAYPWTSPQADLAAAEKLINDCGYHRRDEELADARRAILGTA